MIGRELEVKLFSGKAVVIIGPRRSGKTYYFFHIISRLNRSETVYIDFEGPFLKGLRPLEVLKIVLEIFPEVSGNTSKNVFLDEVQNTESWETLVRSLLNRNLNVFITGSSSRLLSRRSLPSSEDGVFRIYCFPSASENYGGNTENAQNSKTSSRRLNSSLK